MSNFTSANPSFDAMLASWGANGGHVRHINGHLAAGTAATASGGVSGMRWSAPLTIPTVGSGVQGYTLTAFDLIGTSAGTTYYAVLEYLLGTLTLSGNVSSSLGSMPAKTMLGTSITVTGAKYLFCTVRTTGTATTPTITITYTDQDGNTGNSATIVLPTSPAAASAFLITLGTAESGVQAITALSSSVTTGALVLDFYGVLELGVSNQALVTAPHGSVEPVLLPSLPKFLCAAADKVNIYRIGAATLTEFYAALAFAPEVT